MMKKLPFILVALVLVVFPMSGYAVSTTTYTLDMETDFSSTHSVSTTTTYTLEGSLEPISGTNSSSSYEILSGSGFRYYCGDGWIDDGETCDGNNVGSTSCSTQGFNSGTISCNSTCSGYNTTSCATVSSGCGGGGGGGGGSPAQTDDDAPSSPGVADELEDEDYFTYEDTTTLYGDMDEDTESIEVNGSSDDVEYPDDDSWSAEVELEEGENTFTIIAINDEGESEETVVTIYRRASGDVNDDGEIDDYDLSRLVRMWGSDDEEGDFNGDGIVDDYDFSIFVSRWS